MTIFLNILFFVLGIVFLIKGADFFVSGASSIAKKLKISTLIIGLTIVAIGTSLPEFSVSLTSAISKNTDLSVGNIVGSNMLNILLILGTVAIVSPIPIKSTSRKIELPFLLAATLILLLFSLDVILDGANVNIISRVESLLLLVLFILYLFILVFNARKSRRAEINSEEIYEKKEKDLKIWQIINYIIFGLSAVVFGGECVSSTAEYMALKLGMSESLVGLTVVAIGTSLPELMTSIVAAKKGENDIAIGNVVGSNIINTSFILGAVGTISPINVSSVILIDLLVLVIATIVFTVCCLIKNNISKKEGILFLIMYFSYFVFIILRNYCF